MKKHTHTKQTQLWHANVFLIYNLANELENCVLIGEMRDTRANTKIIQKQRERKRNDNRLRKFNG